MLFLITAAFFGLIAYTIANARTQAKIGKINDEFAARRIADGWVAYERRQAKMADAQAAFDALPEAERNHILCGYTGNHEWLQHWILTH